MYPSVHIQPFFGFELSKSCQSYVDTCGHMPHASVLTAVSCSCRPEIMCFDWNKIILIQTVFFVH